MHIPHIIPPNMANKAGFTSPPAALAPPSTPLQPLPLQQPLCSTSVTTIHHTVLQQHAVLLQPQRQRQLQEPSKYFNHQQLLSQVPARQNIITSDLSRTNRPEGFVLGVSQLFVAPPQVPIIPASVLHPSHLAFPTFAPCPLPFAALPCTLQSSHCSPYSSHHHERERKYPCELLPYVLMLIKWIIAYLNGGNKLAKIWLH